MHRTVVFLLAGSLILAGSLRARAAGFSDEAVEKAITRGVGYLWSRQQKGGNWPRMGGYTVGPTALVCYALLESGISPQDPRMARALVWLTKAKTTKTYALALRCNVWEAANRTTRIRSELGKYHKYLRADAKVLWTSHKFGAYHYDCTGKPPANFDNSNTQFALLGLWAATRDNVEVPFQFWQTALTHWKNKQYPDGRWGYSYGGKPNPKPTMTVGGIASLFICFDELYVARFDKCRGGLHFPSIQKGLAWLDKNYPNTVRGAPAYYYYYGVERVGLASGYKYFGKADWYKIGATKLVQAQRGNGAWPPEWGNDLVSTAFALVYLVRGRNAVIFNKLQYDGFWNKRPRDQANLTRWMSRMFERTINWQIINLNVPVSEWHDAPILYISGSKKPNFTDEHINKLRTFVLQGGAIFSVAECGESAFDLGMREAYKRMFPKYRLEVCPPEHTIYTRQAHFDIPGGRPQLYIMSNGVRPLVIHTTEDLSRDWQIRRSVTNPSAFRIAANIARYVTGNVTTLRHRGTTHWPEEVKFTPKRAVRLARLQYAGNWDPEPLAYVRFARLLAQETATKLEVISPVQIKDLAAAGAQVATLTGTGKLKLFNHEVKQLADFVSGGGILVIDSAGGGKAFADSALTMLKEMFPGRRPRQLISGFALYRMPSLEITRVKYRHLTDIRLAKLRVPNLQAIMVNGRPGVLFSREDITAGLVGYPSLTVDGYRPRWAYELMRNIAIYVGTKPRSPERPEDFLAGLKFNCFDSKLTVVGSGTVPKFGPVLKREGKLTVKFTGFVAIPREGKYTLFMAANCPTKFYLGDRELISGAPGGEKSAVVEFQAGKHAVTVICSQADKPADVKVFWQGPGLARQEIPPSALFHVGS